MTVEALEQAFIAAESEDADTLKKLFESGVSPASTDKYGFTLLHALARADYRYRRPAGGAVETCVGLLLDNKASVLKKDRNESMACYHYAARSGNWRFVEALRERGAKLDVAGKEGCTGLHVVADNFDNDRADDFIKTAKAFMAAGVDPAEKDDYGRTAADIAVSRGAKKIVALLSGGMDFFQAMELKDHDAMRAVADADPDAACERPGRFKGLTPLGAACVMIDDEAAAILLAAGADPNLKDASGRTALARLFTADADVNLSSRTFRENRPERLLQAMKDKGFDVNGFADDDENTLLNLACRSVYGGKGYNGRTMKGVAIDWLLAAGADPNVANRDGETPLMHACAGDFDIMENVETALLAAGADVAARDGEGRSALHYAAGNDSHSGAKTMADMLFSFGKPDAAAVDNAGRTALDIATEKGNEPLVKYLLERM